MSANRTFQRSMRIDESTVVHVTEVKGWRKRFVELRVSRNGGSVSITSDLTNGQCLDIAEALIEARESAFANNRTDGGAT